jgi:hypothetical protein
VIGMPQVSRDIAEVIASEDAPGKKPLVETLVARIKVTLPGDLPSCLS